MKPVVILSVLERDPAVVAGILRSVPTGCGMVEIRADLLPAAALPELIGTSPRPVIVTARRAGDAGGGYPGTEQQRVSLLKTALESGAAFVDVEWGSAAMELLQADQASRVILSVHDLPCLPGPVLETYRAMAATTAGRLKLVPSATSVDQIGTIRWLLARAKNDRRPTACFAEGRAGALTRLLAPSWGSWATYGAGGTGSETGRGQFTIQDLTEVYDVLSITPDTRIFGLAGSSLGRSPSPAMHQACYRHYGIDAAYLPLEVDQFDLVDGLSGAIDLEACGVTMPFKDAAFRKTSPADRWSSVSGAVNTVRISGERWQGFNTDAAALARLIRDRIEARGLRAVVAGAGGLGRAAAAVLVELGAEVVLVNRDETRGSAAAEQVRARYEPWSRLAGMEADILVQATPLSREDDLPINPAAGYRLVVDAVYGSVPTAVVAAAVRAGCMVVDGLDLLVEQAVDQYDIMTGHRPSAGIMRAAAQKQLNRTRQLD